MILFYSRQQKLYKYNEIQDLNNLDEMFNYFKDVDIRLLQVDTETSGFNCHNDELLLLQLGDQNVQFVLDYNSLTKNDIKRISEELLNNPKIVKILHNAKFDIKFLWAFGFEICSVYDTMLAETILNGGLEQEKGFFSLKEILFKYTNKVLNKSVRDTISKTTYLNEDVIKYAAEDVKHLELIRGYQLLKLKKYRLVNEDCDCQNIYTVIGLENNAVFPIASMEFNGVKLDTDKWSTLSIVIKEELASVEKDILNEIVSLGYKEFYYSHIDLFNPEPELRLNILLSSPQQKLKLLQKLDKNITSTDKNILGKFKNKYKLVKLIIEYSKLIKLQTSFIDVMFDFINPNTKRIHCNFNQIISTGRMSCDKPNLQQIPSKGKLGALMRECFIPEKGNTFTGGDLSGCELRIIAEFSGDPIWVNSFLEGKDLHSELCAATFGIPIENVKTPSTFKPDLTYRDIQKTLNFGLA